MALAPGFSGGLFFAAPGMALLIAVSRYHRWFHLVPKCRAIFKTLENNSIQGAAHPANANHYQQPGVRRTISDNAVGLRILFHNLHQLVNGKRDDAKR
jgi:hypothetical protein